MADNRGDAYGEGERMKHMQHPIYWYSFYGKRMGRGVVVMDEPGAPLEDMQWLADEAWQRYYYWMDVCEPEGEVFV